MSAPTWTDSDETLLRQAIRNKLKRSHLVERKQAATAYLLWKALPWWKRPFARKPR